MTFQQINDLFKAGFGELTGRFSVKELKIQEAIVSSDPMVYRPGVYVFIKDGQVIKVGKHFINTRKRALQHISDNTHTETFQMADLINDSDCSLILFNLNESTELHWVSALETFFELNLKPIIKSKRLG